VKKYLAQRKKISPDDKGVFGSFNLQDEFDKVQGLFTGIEVFSWVVAVGTIFAGAVGVGNIMLIVVKERTREIGLAQGARRHADFHRRHDHAGVAVHHGDRRLQRPRRRRVAARNHLARCWTRAAARLNFFSHPEMDFKTAIVALLVLIVCRCARFHHARGQGRRGQSDHCVAGRIKNETNLEVPGAGSSRGGVHRHHRFLCTASRKRP
jgi:putative ABC transport system permease protein